MLMAADALLDVHPHPTEAQVQDALGGVLCRCTGYRKIVEAVAHGDGAAATVDGRPPASAVGARIARVDGVDQVTGATRFGADEVPAGALHLRAVRSPHAHARFTVGDLAGLHAAHPGLVRVLLAADVPGATGTASTRRARTSRCSPTATSAIEARPWSRWSATPRPSRGSPTTSSRSPGRPLPPLLELDAAADPGAVQLHEGSPGNLLAAGRVVRGDVDAALAASAVVASGTFETAHVEHAYIEPEAGYAERHGDRITVYASTQTPYMDRDEIALIMGFEPDRVQVIPSACGGGFGGKLDLSLQPLVAMAAWILDRPVRCVYTRPESMRSTTKRHPARITGSLGADADGRLTAIDLHGDFDTGAYASWGPTVANRVPVHASGPVRRAGGPGDDPGHLHERPDRRGVPRVRGPAGGHRPGGPARRRRRRSWGWTGSRSVSSTPCGPDRSTATGQVLVASAGLAACLEALRPAWDRATAEAADARTRRAGDRGTIRRGVGIGAMWYGIGNTSLPNPSTIRIGLRRDGTYVLFSGAQEIGQGSNTVMTQIAADALDVPLVEHRARHRRHGPHARLGQDLGLAPDVRVGQRDEARGRGPASTDGGVRPGPRPSSPRTRRAASWSGPAATTRTPRRSMPDGQGIPYETYGFGAQVAEVDVDLELGTTVVRRIVAAHDVGRAVNPMLVEGQIHGGIAQGLGPRPDGGVPRRTDRQPPRLPHPDDRRRARRSNASSSRMPNRPGPSARRGSASRR